MKYTIYKITNNINGKFYIGKHQTKDINDSYMGSGKLLRRAQNKNGIDNFTKEILFVFDSEAEMNAKERELVTDEFCLREDTYNLCVGGLGGFSYIHRENIKGFLGKKHTTQSNKIKSIKNKEFWNALSEDEKLQRRLKNKEGKKRQIEEGLGNVFTSLRNPMYDDDIKIKHKKAVSSNSKGEKNSQYGSMWITNGLSNRKVKSIDCIPEGWYAGRKMNKDLRG